MIQKWINTNCLPKDSRGKINWANSAGLKIEFKYDTISGYLKILKYEHSKDSAVIYIDGYTNENGVSIKIDSLRNCAFGKIFKKPIAETNPELLQYFVDKKDAYKYTSHSGKRVELMCPNCGNKKYNIIEKLVENGFSCSVCSDGLSYPNKFMYHILSQLGVKFINEVSARTDGFHWIINGYRYDFYFDANNKRYFIEMDGAFHYKNIFLNTYDQNQADETKNQIAQSHNIHMIRINCNYCGVSNRFQFIKEQILISELNNIFDLSIINWDAANQYSLSSKIIDVINLWNSGVKFTKEIANQVNLSVSTVVSYLKIGNNIGLCKYNLELAEINRKEAALMAVSKPLLLLKDNIEVGIFRSASELERKSYTLYGKRIMKCHISEVLRGDRKQTCGYTAKEITYEEYERLVPQFANTVQN